MGFNEFESLFNLNKGAKGMNRVYGIIGIKAKMANWNADFTGRPKSQVMVKFMEVIKHLNIL